MRLVSFCITQTSLESELTAEGDFEIDDVLDPLPKGCASPMLLIRNAANGGWFAVGILDD